MYACSDSGRLLPTYATVVKNVFCNVFCFNVLKQVGALLRGEHSLLHIQNRGVGVFTRVALCLENWGTLYLTTITRRRYCTNLLAQVVLFFSVFVLKMCICPVLAQPVPDSSRRPVVCCEAINQAFLFYTAQYHEGNYSEFPSVWVA